MHNIWICDMNKEFVQQNFIRCGTMTAPRDSPATLALKGKIYVLGGLYFYPYPGEPDSPMTPFAEVFNTFTNSCMPLPDPEVWDVKGLDKDLNGFFWAALDDTDEIVCCTAHAAGSLLYSLKVGDGVRTKKWKMYTIPPPPPPAPFQRFRGGKAMVIDRNLIWLSFEHGGWLVCFNLDKRRWLIEADSGILDRSWARIIFDYPPQIHYLGNGCFCVLWLSRLHSPPVLEPCTPSIRSSRAVGVQRDAWWGARIPCQTRYHCIKCAIDIDLDSDCLTSSLINCQSWVVNGDYGFLGGTVCEAAPQSSPSTSSCS